MSSTNTFPTPNASRKIPDLLRLFYATGEDEAGEEPEGDGPGQTDQTITMPRERGQGHSGLGLSFEEHR